MGCDSELNVLLEASVSLSETPDTLSRNTSFTLVSQPLISCSFDEQFVFDKSTRGTKSSSLKVPSWFGCCSSSDTAVTVNRDRPG